MRNYVISAACIFISFQSYAVVFGDNDIESAKTDKLTQLESIISAPVAIMIKNEILQQKIEGNKGAILKDIIWDIFSIPGGDANGARKICKDTKFLEEEAIGTCSGVLIAPDLIATAAHCLWGSDILDNSWVFNYNDSNSINEEDIYRAKSVELVLDSPIKWAYSEEVRLKNIELRKNRLPPLSPDIMNHSSYQDIAVIRLKSTVKRIEPAVADFNQQSRDTPLTLIGFPLGLSKKIIRNGVVVGDPTSYYTTNNSDVFKGNSGGPVFNSNTGKLVGIMVNQGRNSAFKLNRKKRCYELTQYDEAETSTGKLSGYMNINMIQSLVESFNSN